MAVGAVVTLVAPVPPLPTGSVPVTAALWLSATWLNVGTPPELPTSTLYWLGALVDVGDDPVPPPSTTPLLVRAPEELKTELVLKYGTPPLVPLTVSLIVPVVVMGEPDTPKIPPGDEKATLVTVPPVCAPYS